MSLKKHRKAALLAGAGITLSILASPPAHAQKLWTGSGGSAFWDVTANWQNNTLPGINDDVVNNTAQTIDHRLGADTISSFLSNTAAFTLSGGSLTAKTLGVSTFQVNNTFSMTGGTLAGFVVNAGSGGQGITFNSSFNNTLSAITSNANLDLSAGGVVRVVNGLTLNGVATLNNSAFMAFQSANNGTQTLGGTGSIVFGANGNNRISIEPVNSNNPATLVIGSGMTLRGTNGSIGSFFGYASPNTFTLTNNGVIAADVSGGTISVSASVLNNNNILRAQNGGTLTVSVGGGTNAASITAQTGSTVNVNGSTLTNTGTVSTTGTGSALSLSGGLLTNTATLSAANGGLLTLAGATTVAQTGAGAVGIDATSRLNQNNGTISGGVVNVTSGGKFVVYAQPSNTLNGVTFNGALDMATIAGSQERVTGGLTLNGTATLNNSAFLAFQSANNGNQTLTGNAEILFGATGNNRISIEPVNSNNPASLTLDTNVLIHGQNGNIGSFFGYASPNTFTLTNNGVITADVSSGTISVNASVLNNNNALRAQNGGTLTVSVGGGTNAGSVTAQAGSTVNVNGSTQANTGTLSATGAGATLSISGGLINNSATVSAVNGGVVALAGATTLAQTGAGALSADATSRINQNNGAVSGGAVNVASGGKFVVYAQPSNTLNGVTFNGALDMATIGGAQERVTGGLTLNGQANLNNGAFLAFQSANGGNQTLGGTADILFGATGNNRISIEPVNSNNSASLTLAAGTIIHGQNGNIGSFFGYASPNTFTLTNNGTIAADVATGILTVNASTLNNTSSLLAQNGGTLTVSVGGGTNSASITAQSGSTVNINGSTQTNTGTIAATGTGATVSISGSSITNNGTIAATGGGLVALAGASTISQTGVGVVSVDATSRLNQNNASVNSTINVASGGKFVVYAQPGNTLNAATFNGALDMATISGAQERVTGGLTLNGTATLNNGAFLAFQSANNGSQTLTGNAEILFGATGNNRISIEPVNSNNPATLVLDTNALIHGQNGNIGSFFGYASPNTFTMTNNGVIAADVATGVLSVNASVLNNNNALRAQNGGTLTVSVGGGTSAGTITAQAGSTVNVNSSALNNTGAASATGAGATLSVSVSNLSNSGTLSAANGGLVALAGAASVTQTGAGAVGIDATSRLNQNNGTVSGGAVNVTSGGKFVVYAQPGNNLNAVTFNGALDMATITGAQERVTGGLTLNGQANLNNGAFLAFQSPNNGTQTVTGNADIKLGTTGNNRISIEPVNSNNPASLTLDTNVLVHGVGGVGSFFGYASPNVSTLVNNGTVSADINAGTLTVSTTAITNGGTLRAQNGGILLLNAAVANTGLVDAQAGSSVTLSGGGTNTGTIQASGANALLNLTGGTTTQTGGGTIAINGAGAKLNQSGGGIAGGVVNITGGGVFVPTNNGANALGGGATVNGNIDMSAGGAEVVAGGLTLNGAANINGGGYIQFNGVETLGGNATITLGNSTANRLYLGNNAALTLGANTLVQGQNGQFIASTPSQTSTTTLINNGRVSANVSGGTITVQPGTLTNNATGTLEAVNGGHLVTIGIGTITNNGVIQAGNGVGSSVVDIACTTLFNTASSTIQANAGGTINLNGGTYLQSIGAGIYANGSGSTLNLNGVTISGGSVGATGGGAFVIGNNAGNTFTNGVQFVGGVASGTSGQATFTGGLGLSGGQTFEVSNGANYGFSGSQSIYGNGSFYFRPQPYFGGADYSGNVRIPSGGGGGVLNVGSGITFYGGGGNFGLNGDGQIILTGSMRADNPSFPFYINPGTLTVNAGGSLGASGGGTLVIGQTGPNGGASGATTTNLNDGLTTAAIGSLIDLPTGSINMYGGVMDIDGRLRTNAATGGSLNLFGGNLTGGGTIIGNTFNTGGVISPDRTTGTTPVGQVGSLTFTGNYSQSGTGSLLVELGGLAGGQFDVFNVSGLASLGSGINVSLLGGYLPRVGDTFTFFNYGSRTGTWSAINSLNSGYAYTVDYNNTNAVLRVTSTGTGSASAPEPGSLALLLPALLGGAGVVVRRRKA